MTIAGTIIIRDNPTPPITKGGIWLPESMQTENNIAEVLFVGAAKGDKTPEVEVGGHVVYMHKSHRIRSFELEGENVKRINFEDVFMIEKK